MLCVLSSSGSACHSEYVLWGSLVKSNIVWQIELSEYFVLSVISFLATARDGSPEKG